MHVGGINAACPKLTVQAEEMLTSCSEKCIGDILVNTGKIYENLLAIFLPNGSCVQEFSTNKWNPI